MKAENLKGQLQFINRQEINPKLTPLVDFAVEIIRARPL
jgi:hypothetical protein